MSGVDVVIIVLLVILISNSLDIHVSNIFTHSIES